MFLIVKFIKVIFIFYWGGGGLGRESVGGFVGMKKSTLQVSVFNWSKGRGKEN